MDRAQKILQKRIAKDVNNVGRRIEWARRLLGLLQKQVAIDAQIPFSTYCGREAGVRTGMHEEILLIAQVLDREWQKKFTERTYPKFNGTVIKDITPMWLLFGGDSSKEHLETAIQDLRRELAEKEAEHNRREMEMTAQLCLFKLDTSDS
jgi:transcriptional regulator with XRE-family HTH domain